MVGASQLERGISSVGQLIVGSPPVVPIRVGGVIGEVDHRLIVAPVDEIGRA